MENKLLLRYYTFLDKKGLLTHGGGAEFVNITKEFKETEEYKSLQAENELYEKNQKLKDLAIAYKCAQEYDYCPDSSEVDDVLKIIWRDIDRDVLIKILDKYSGYSTGDIEGNVFHIINNEL